MLRFSLTATLVLLLTLPLFATTYYVDAAKGDDANPGTAIDAPWKTLDKANAALSPGDTCIVRAGVYADTQIAPARSGTPDALITYVAYEGETPEVTGGKSGSIILLRDRAFIVVKGFKIHSPTEHDWTVNLSGKDCTHNVIADCDVSDPKGYVCIDIADGASYNEVSGCVVHDTGNADQESGDCIVMNSGASHNAILRNKCFNGCHSQIMALKGSKFNLIADNDLYSTDRAWAGAGVNLPLGADNNTVSGNRIHDLGFITNEKCAIQVDSANNTVDRNIIYNVGAFGISPQSYTFRGTAQGSQGNLIANNTIYHAGRQGLYFTSKQECLSSGNRIMNNIVIASDSMWYDKSARIMVFDTYHLSTPVQPGAWFENVFKNNIFLHDAPGAPDMALYSYKTGTKSWSLAELQKEFPDTFSGNLEVDPKFLDPEKGDFRIKPDSPCIDAGLDVGLPYQGKAIDIGASEAPAPRPEKAR